MSNIATRSFSTGEVSPSLYARTDLQRYTSALRTCRNFIALRDGGAANRPGTEYVGACGRSRLLPFVFNDEQTYVLVFSAGAIDIVQDGAFIGVTVVTTYTAAELFALQITQSADVLTIVHPSHPVAELKRLGALTWTLTDVVFGPTVQAPANVAGTVGTAGPLHMINWVVTALAADGSESYASDAWGVNAPFLVPHSHAAQTLTWDSVVGATGYRIYKAYMSGGVGTYGYLGLASATTFFDDGLKPDTENQPTIDPSVFDAVGEYPAAVANAQQRRILAGSSNEPETFRTSRTADLNNFTVSVPTQDDDAITATLVSKKVNAIRHIVDADRLFVGTSGGWWVLNGDSAGILRPTDINGQPFSKRGVSLIPPIVVDNRVVFVQALQATIREIVTNDAGPGYVPSDLTKLSRHLFTGKQIVDSTYQEEPHSILWFVRSDGVLLGLTYMDEEKILAWHRHDTQGLVESVCAIPEDGEDRLYLVVNRGGARMVERMASRYFTDVKDAVFMDASLSYDGRNTDLFHKIKVSGSTSWDYDEELTVESDQPFFTADDVGNAIHFTTADGLPLKVRLTAYTDTTHMQGFPERLVPASHRNQFKSTWTRAVDTVTGLNHLNGRSLAVTADGYVVASPYNDGYALQCVVSGGSITLDQPYGYIRAGLPYISDLETLDIDTPSGPSVKEKKFLVNGLMAYVEASRGFFAGQSLPTGADPLQDMDELKIRDVSEEFGLIDLKTDADGVNFPASWNTNGRVAIRNVDPIPLTVLAVMPRGTLSST